MTIVENKRTVIVGASLVTYLKAITVFASTDAARPVINSVYFECVDGKLRLTATDSYMMGVLNTTIECDDFESFMVSAADITAAIKVITGKHITYSITREDNNVTFGGMNDISVRRVEGDYPNYTNLIPTTCVPVSVAISPKNFERLGKAVALIGALCAEYIGSKDDRSPQVFLAANADRECELLVLIMPVRNPKAA